MAKEPTDASVSAGSASCDRARPVCAADCAESLPRVSRLAASRWMRGLALLGIVAGAALWLAMPPSAWEVLAEPIGAMLRSLYGTRGQVHKIAAALARLPPLLAAASGAGYFCLLAWGRILRSAPLASTTIRVEADRPTCGRRDGVIILILTLVALALRLPGMGQSLWLDELAMLKVFVERGPLAIVLPRSSLGPHPLMELLAWCALSLGGSREWVLRSPALLAGILAVPVTYVVALRFSGRRATAITAALLVALHSFHAYYSFQLKGYTLVALLALVSVGLLVRLLEGPSRRVAIALAVVNTLLVYTHLFAIYFCVAEYSVVTCVGLYGRRTAGSRRPFPSAAWHQLWFSLLGSVCGVAALYVPQLPVVAMNLLDTTAQSDSAGHLGRVLTGSSVLLSARESPAFSGVLLLTLAIYFALPGRRDALNGLVAVLLLFVAATAVIPLGGSGFYSRYLAAGIPLAGIAVADVVVRLCALNGLRGRAAGVTLLAVVLAVTLAGYGFAYLPIQDYRGAIALVRERAAPGATIVANCFGKDVIQHYEPGIVPLADPPQLTALLASGRQIWAVTSIGCDTGRWPFQYDRDTQAVIERRFALEAELPGLGPVRVWRFDAAGSGSPAVDTRAAIAHERE
jgi:hypothetical protein